MENIDKDIKEISGIIIMAKEQKEMLLEMRDGKLGEGLGSSKKEKKEGKIISISEAIKDLRDYSNKMEAEVKKRNEEDYREIEMDSGGEKEVVQKRIGDDSSVDKPEPVRLSSNGTSIVSKNEGIPSTHSKPLEPKGIESEEDRLVRVYVFMTFKSMIIDELSEIIRKSYLKDGYCLKIIDILQNAMFEIGETSLDDADKHFLEEMEKMKE